MSDRARLTPSADYPPGKEGECAPMAGQARVLCWILASPNFWASSWAAPLKPSAWPQFPYLEQNHEDGQASPSPSQQEPQWLVTEMSHPQHWVPASQPVPTPKSSTLLWAGLWSEQLHWAPSSPGTRVGTSSIPPKQCPAWSWFPESGNLGRVSSFSGHGL